MAIISTKVHGVLDYTSVPALLALPRMLGWSERTTRLLSVNALAALGYSLLTRYELGLIKVLPMQVHLVLDGMSGTLLCAVAIAFTGESPGATRGLLGLGLIELGAALLTKTEPS